MIADGRSGDLKVLLVDDDDLVLSGFTGVLLAAGFRDVRAMDDNRKIDGLLHAEDFDVVVLDLFMPHKPGLETLKEIVAARPDLPVIVMTGVDEIERAVECMRAGAFDYLVKPVERARFIDSIRQANLLRQSRTVSGEPLSERMLATPRAFDPIITESDAMLSLFRYMEVVAASPQPVLIYGETGTGKELAARSVHEASGRKGEFVEVNVAGLDDAMFSDTLFGHTKGAYTGADRARAGLIEKAKGGTLFLDEIGDLSEASQVKLLRLLQDHSYYPIGSDLPKKSDARVVAATNRNLKEQSNGKGFRKDLYYRLSAHTVTLPPLRERMNDVPLLAAHFLEKSAAMMGKKKPATPKELFTLLSTYDFPGNIRELEAMVFDAVARHRSGVLSLRSFEDYIHPGRERQAEGKGLKLEAPDGNFDLFGRFPTLKEMDDYLVEMALKRADSNQRMAASMLGITRQALNKRLVRKKDAAA